MKRQETIIPIYEARLIFIVSSDFKKDYEETVKEIGGEIEEVTSDLAGIVIHELLSFAIILNKQDLSHRFIAHEVFHLVVSLLEVLGEKFPTETHESYAYLCGWITDWIYKSLKIMKIKI